MKTELDALDILRNRRPSVAMNTTVADIEKANCGKRADCVAANTVNRAFNLGGKGCIMVDAREIAFSRDGLRFHFQPDRKVVTMLRKFDEIGALHGTKVAREQVDPMEWKMRLISATPVRPPRTSELNGEHNKKQRERRKEKGSAKSLRFTGV